MNACKLVGLLLLLLWGHTALYAQQVRTVRGRVQTVKAGSNEKRALPSASIVILAKSDSAFINGITSDKNGRFILNYQPQKKKKYLLSVYFVPIFQERFQMPWVQQLSDYVPYQMKQSQMQKKICQETYVH